MTDFSNRTIAIGYKFAEIFTRFGVSKGWGLLELTGFECNKTVNKQYSRIEKYRTLVLSKT